MSIPGNSDDQAMLEVTQLRPLEITPLNGGYVGVETVEPGDDSQREAQVLHAPRHGTGNRHHTELAGRIEEEHTTHGDTVSGTHPVDPAVVGRILDRAQRVQADIE